MAKRKAEEKAIYNPADSPALHVSYGDPIPQPEMVKGKYDAFGESAGTTSRAQSLVPKRNITFDDSIGDNRKNQPASH